MSEYLGVLIIAIIYCGLVGAIIGDIRDMAGPGFFLGLFCGPFGWIIIACMPKEHRPAGRWRTPEKRELMMKCKCGADLDVAFLPSGPYKCPICGHHLDITNDPAK